MSFTTTHWIYPEGDNKRDLRLDFMRGFVIPLLIAAHFDYFSVLMYIGWERVGVISSAEIFVTLSGIVIGTVYGRRIQTEGFENCLSTLLRRAAQLYRVNVAIILSIGLLRYLPFLDTTAVTNFHDPYANINYPLYPPLQASFFELISSALMLRCGPHQFQVIGLYVALFALITPLFFWMISKKRLKLLVGISWCLYLINFGMPEKAATTAEIRWTGAQFEYAFPLIAWQLVYLHGLLIGYYEKKLLAFFNTVRGKQFIYFSFFLSACFLVFTLNHPMAEFANWSKLSFIPPETFDYLYTHYFQKYKLGPGRLINMVVLLLSIYVLLTRFWLPINRVFGWFLIPLGQASLYVFVVHVFVLLLISNTPLPGLHNFWVNSLIHIGVLSTIWIMVKTEFLFRWIPR